ncbi:cation diffusion facilitator family transporter [Paracoccus sp. SSK6]|uniref:cation diffusion facilitator family transporter n=1 Tax=Paracoccus sp. SSK6 TaxID=3143131 RepID=UPI00321A1F01
MNRTIKIALGSIVVGIMVLGFKTLAWHMTGSVALLSDALESTVNVATAVAALIAIRIAQRPADRSHPYGHHKAEFLSAVLEGVMIIVAALLILEEAYSGIRNPQPMDAPVNGLLINAFAGCINAFWCLVLIRQGRRLKSPALLADGQHLLSDVVTSGGVILGVSLAVFSGYPILDPILAGLVAVNILWSGWKVMSASLGGLMDRAVSDDILRKIRATISDHADGAIEAHDLRTRHAGSMTFIDFHLVVDGDTPVAQAHAICDRIEAALKKQLDDAQITIHVEPEHKAKHSGVLVL